MDIGMLIVSSAINIVEKLIYGWINEKRKKISYKEIEKQTDQAVETVSKQQHLNPDDLRRITQEVTQQVIKSIPGIGTSGLIGKGITIDCSSTEKSRQLIRNLEAVLDDVEKEYQMSSNNFQNQVSTSEDNIPEFLPINNKRNSSGSDIPCASINEKSQKSVTYSQKLIEELRQKIAESENIRK
ncbi:hypothetical protein [Mediterraneibacter glycyrrhizinilyticus]|uniref:hypothetical protein n=1 Tax=Mediterraneibacter glycyrrhizinilyticus TaxID=342942 RepID=UPI0025A3BBF2|nr:hypothetical protein [Mediterraneibacter glycyrrhizinilyticus]MDM8211848.1 hypothetical protein [Mediterraneibacter glycyrrhizinilyticus]